MTPFRHCDTVALEQQRRDLNQQLAAIECELARRYREASDELRRQRTAWQSAQVLQDKADFFKQGGSS